MRGGSGQLGTGSGQFRIVDSSGREITVDPSTHAQETVDYVHHEIHAGSHFFVSGYVALDNGDKFEWAVTTPATDKEPHMEHFLQSTALMTFEVFEDADVSGGQPVIIRNNNRRSTKASVLTITSNPTTITNSGECIDSFKVGTATVGGNKVGNPGGASRDDEMILNSNMTYLYRVTSGANGNVVSFRGSWYEHTPKG